MNALISLIPVALLFILMLGFKVSGWKSALITLIVTGALAIWGAPAMGIIPQKFAGEAIGAVVCWSVVEGGLKAIFPILLIIIMAIYSYNVIVESKAIETIKAQITSLTGDRGVLVLLMVWGFGGLLEGMAGFGTAVAIPAAILIGLGFKPMFSALVALLGNTVATGFGAVGVPVMTLCNEVSPGGATPQTVHEISTFTIVQLAPLFFLIPFIILLLTDHKAWVKNITLALWTGGISLTVQLLCAIHIGAETPAVLGSVAAIIAIVAYDKIFLRTPKISMSQTNGEATRVDTEKPKHPRFTVSQTLRAWSVYIFILLFILFTGALCPPISKFLSGNLVTKFQIPVIASTFKFGWISNAGLWLFLGSVVGGLCQGLSPKQLTAILAKTVVGLRFTTITIISLIALASVMNYSGMIAAIGAGLVAVTGSFYPLFAPLIGAVGTFVTGSDTSSNILFGKLQANVAHQLGMSGQAFGYGFSGTQVDWLAASNTAGATGGKMISPQSIAIATAACEMEGSDDAIMQRAIPYALLYLLICGLTVYFGC
ncbi:MAG: L-lactate permease [Clostridium sp.]|nr:L-lactate permease [Prevotella sp.]MCM1429675.1 L-lactate permease [Clostridium sp.]